MQRDELIEIVHDFNNAIGIIVNYAQFAAEGVSADSSVAADLAEVRKAAERAAEINRRLAALLNGR